MNFSLIAIVYNEEKRLEKALEYFKNFTDDIVVFDTESNDNTYNIAEKFATKLMKVPFVGYCDCYKEHAMLRAKYEWCLFLYPDEKWNDDILNYIKSLDDNIEEKAISFKRKEYIDGIEAGGFSGWHIRLFKRGFFYACDLGDAEISCGYKILQLEKYLIHSKTSDEAIMDRKLRKIAYDILIQKYKHTNMEPYKSMRESYKNDRNEIV